MTVEPTGVETVGHNRAHAAWFCLALSAAAFGLYLVGVGRSFWLDEIVSVDLSQLPWPQFAHAIGGREANMALYFLLLRALGRFADVEMAARLPSILAAVLTLPLIFALGRRLFGRRSAILAAVLLAVNAFHLHYAQEARGYALVELLTTLGTWLLLISAQQQRRAYWAAYAVIMLLGVYTHVCALFVLMAHAVAVFSSSADAAKRRFVLAGLAIVAASVPLVLTIRAHGPAMTADWIAPLSLGQILKGFYALAGGSDGVGIVFLVCVAIGAYNLTSSSDEDALQPIGLSRSRLILSWLCTPIAALALGSLWHPLFLDRFLILVLPPFLLLITAFVTRLATPTRRTVAAVVLIALSVVRVGHFLSKPASEDWLALSQYVVQHAADGESLVVQRFFTRPCFEHYRRQFGDPDVPRALYPGSWKVSAVDPDVATPDARWLRELAARNSGIWLIQSHIDDAAEEPVVAVFEKAGYAQELVRFPGLELRHFTPPG